MRARLLQAGVQIDAINRIVKRWNALDLTDELRDRWSAMWEGVELANFALLSQADQMDRTIAIEKQFQQQTLNDRILHAVTRATSSSRDRDLHWAGLVAMNALADVVSFNEDVLVRVVKPSGKIRYSLYTEIDVEVRLALIEVTTQLDASGKVAQLELQLDPISNPLGKPVFQMMPMIANVDPSVNRSVRELLNAGSSGVFNDLAALKAALAKL